jgi:hypothetical protein
MYAPALGGPRPPTPTLALVSSVSADDLRGCADRVAGWREQGLATPLVLTADEFARSLDAFPFEFGAIMASHQLVTGADPFDGLRVDPADLRHACEVQARSHLLHLREGYIETEGRADRVADLIAGSAEPLAALLLNVSRLNGHPADHVTIAAQTVERLIGLEDGHLARVVGIDDGHPLSGADAHHLFPPYLDAVDRLTRLVDRWSD